VARTRTRSVADDKNNRNTTVAADRRRTQDDSEGDDSQAARKDRPTPSTRQTKTRGVGSTGLINRIPVVRNIVAYFRGVFSEMQKVSWPSSDETRRLTYVVMGVTVAFAVGLGVMDTFLGWWFRNAFHADSEWIFLVVGALVAVILGGSWFTFRDRI
jgi:preprotein translocase SecE subunit